MGSKTLQIHCYYRVSQEQSSSTVTFQALIWNEIVGDRWRENGHFRWSALFSNSLRCYHGESVTLWVFRSLENAFAAILHLKMLSDIDPHNKLQPQSPCSFMQISLYIILLTQKLLFWDIFILSKTLVRN